MSINVYAWPPVGVTGSEWTEEAPVQVSRSRTTGADYRSATQRKRRVASLRVSSLAMGRNGAGYVEVLKKYLAGIHAVRLNSYPINWHLDAIAEAYRRPIDWTEGRWDLEWTETGTELLWYSGTPLTGSTGTDAQGFPRIIVSGLPGRTLVARPGEFLTVYDGSNTTVQVANEATSDASGNVNIRLLTALPTLTDVPVGIGTSDTGVFYPVTMPRSMQPVGGDWSYMWEFREVFSDEVGGFTEVNPWV